MDPDSSLNPHDLLPRDAYLHLIHMLRGALPPVDGPPERAAIRDRAAIAQAASLCPANAAEAAVAAQFVAANMQAMACLRLANDPDAPRDQAIRCTAQSAGMMREAQGALRLLLRLQAVRAKRDSDETAASQAAWSEHRAANWMLEGAAESLLGRRILIDNTSETDTRQASPGDPGLSSGLETVESPIVRQNITNDGFETDSRQDNSGDLGSSAGLETVESPLVGQNIINGGSERDPRQDSPEDPGSPAGLEAVASPMAGQHIINDGFETDVRPQPANGSADRPHPTVAQGQRDPRRSGHR